MQIRKTSINIGLLISVVTILLAVYTQYRKVANLETQVILKDEEAKARDQQIKKLTNYVTQNAKIPEPGTLDAQGIPESLASRYYLVYMQLVLLSETAKLPEQHMEWLRDLVRKGVLHNVVEQLNFIGYDEKREPPEIVTELSIYVNWEQGRLYSELKTQPKQEVPEVHNQPTMMLATAFATLVEKERLKVQVGCKTVKRPNQKALLTLGVPEYVTKDPKNDSENAEFQKLILSTLHLEERAQPKWREGSSIVMTATSNITPELSTTLKYVDKQAPVSSSPTKSESPRRKVKPIKR